MFQNTYAVVLHIKYLKLERYLIKCTWPQLWCPDRPHSTTTKATTE